MIYIHVPFCRSFCTYCDFYSELACAGKSIEQMKAYAAELRKEIALRKDEYEKTNAVSTVYLGGGTPSVLPLDVLKYIVAALPQGSGCEEFTIEVNPDDIVQKGQDYVRELLDMGISRVSMGVQTLSDPLLKWMNRRHDASAALEAFAILRQAGVRNISLDLIFGIGHLSDETLLATLSQFIKLSPEHISAYQLSIEEGSALAQMLSRGQYSPASDEQCERQYSLICSELASAGYEHYEISNWAKPGYRAVHNAAYWTRQAYLGLGPGAHSFDGVQRSSNSLQLQGWTRTFEPLGEDEIKEEKIMLGLRTSDGILPHLCDPAALNKLLSEGLLETLPSGRVRIPEKHFFVSDNIIADLF